MVIFNFIGYFTLVLHDFLLPGATKPFWCSDFSGFIPLLCHLYLCATFSGLRPRLFFSDPPPCYNPGIMTRKQSSMFSADTIFQMLCFQFAIGWIHRWKICGYGVADLHRVWQYMVWFYLQFQASTGNIGIDPFGKGANYWSVFIFLFLLS
jgi:hypothetical protein